jgi:hypothetical protein
MAGQVSTCLLVDYVYDHYTQLNAQEQKELACMVDRCSNATSNEIQETSAGLHIALDDLPASLLRQLASYVESKLNRRRPAPTPAAD